MSTQSLQARSRACAQRWKGYSVARPNDLAGLRRLASLCEIRHRLALQDEAEAGHAAEAATRRRSEGEAAVADALQGWHRVMESMLLGPDAATAAGAALIERASALTIATDREAESQRMLAACGDVRREAHARLRQAEDVATAWRRKLSRKGEERVLATVEDRIAYRRSQP